MMFYINSTPEYTGECSCESLRHGNLPQVKRTISAGLVAAMQGWDYYCIVRDYDDVAKEEMDKTE
jgi:hypothetical protein